MTHQALELHWSYVQPEIASQEDSGPGWLLAVHLIVACNWAIRETTTSVKGKWIIQVTLVLCSDSSLKCEYHVRSAKELHVYSWKLTNMVEGLGWQNFCCWSQQWAFNYTICESKGKVSQWLVIACTSMKLSNLLLKPLVTISISDGKESHRFTLHNIRKNAWSPQLLFTLTIVMLMT